MASNVNRRWILSRRPDGRVAASDFSWAESSVPAPKDGEILLRNLWLSMNPTQVLFANGDAGAYSIPIGEVMRCTAASRVVESRVPGFEAGDLVQGWSGWEDYSLTNGLGPTPADFHLRKVPPGTPLNMALGTFGATGMAAYFGVVDVGRPKPGETFVVDSAAGGVGSVAGQIARILGCRVIGITSGRERCEWLRKELRFDEVIDRQTEEVEAQLNQACPDGIDIFFFNSGVAPVLDAALARLRRFGRVVLCGGTSSYLAKESPPGPKRYLALIMRHGRMEGVLHWDFVDRYEEARAAIEGWIRAREFISPEDVLSGLERAPEALNRVFSGSNRGKQLLKIAES